MLKTLNRASVIMCVVYWPVKGLALWLPVRSAIVVERDACSPLVNPPLRQFEQHFKYVTIFVWKNTSGTETTP